MNGETRKRERKNNVRKREAQKLEERTRTECKERQGTDDGRREEKKYGKIKIKQMKEE
jgi:hypothetical protein